MNHPPNPLTTWRTRLDLELDRKLEALERGGLDPHVAIEIHQAATGIRRAIRLTSGLDSVEAAGLAINRELQIHDGKREVWAQLKRCAQLLPGYELLGPPILRQNIPTGAEWQAKMEHTRKPIADKVRDGKRHGSFVDLTGRVVSGATVLEEVPPANELERRGGTVWRCKCACRALFRANGSKIREAERTGGLLRCGHRCPVKPPKRTKLQPQGALDS